jgi:hypothetical protein
MTPINNGNPSEPSPTLASSLSPLRLSKQRFGADPQSPTSSISSLPYRPNSGSVSSLFASTTPPGSRSISPNGALAASKVLSGSVFNSTRNEDVSQGLRADQSEDPRHLILQAFIPHIAVLTSTDTDDLVRDKGFSKGLWQLLRPFGEHVQGKVIIRDSIGASRVYEDFAVRFTQLGDGLAGSLKLQSSPRIAEEYRSSQNSASIAAIVESSRIGGNVEAIESVVERHLDYAERFHTLESEDLSDDNDKKSIESSGMSPFYMLYLRRLLSAIPLTPHETFSHPVACIIAISSRCTNSIEELRRLYDESNVGEKRLPAWVNPDYLRYYVLVHDEEKDDIGKSMNLFEQMKRHFGLHCHLLRLRSSQCVPTDDDSVTLPACDWVAAEEELADIQMREDHEDIEIASPCIYESDATAINTFIREMVTQSVVPSMERSVSTWNDQELSKRRGISGRFMSLSKKWTVFGSSSRTSSAGSGTATGSNANYDSIQGFYRPDAPEAIMRKLADYAFMLRDWKLAQSVYELLRSDFNNDKAWRYHAAANEMAAISTLMGSQSIGAKVRSETIDQMLETASYSYLTRCGLSYGTLRSTTLGMELLRIRGGSASDDAARWGTKVLESNVVGSIGDALMKERVAACYASHKGAGSGRWGARTRKSALWNILAAEQWLLLEKFAQGEKNLATVRSLHGLLRNPEGLSGFSSAKAFLTNLEHELRASALANDDGDGHELEEDEVVSIMDEESEALDARRRRRSLIGASIPPIANLETAPLHTLEEDGKEQRAKDDDFE